MLYGSYDDSGYKKLTIALEWGTIDVDDLTEVSISSDFTILKVATANSTYFFYHHR